MIGGCMERCSAHTSLVDKVDEVGSDIKDIRCALLGNIQQGELGLVHRVKMNSEYVMGEQKKKYDIYMAIIRSLTVILLTYIAWKIGVRPQ